jgi:hypothetical protein
MYLYRDEEETMIILSNCVSAMIGAFSNVMPTLGGGLDEYEEDRDGVVHIGNLSV